ncbi:MAG: GDSL-type esterase/lipase family protein [Phycisphaerales bacterium]|nr:GDSL-type esterase/lipase family protein [Phycisphaerales bacterium]
MSSILVLFTLLVMAVNPGSTVRADEDDGEGVELTRAWKPIPVEADMGEVEYPILREIANRIIHGRVNLNLVGDSISHTDMSAAYLATFRPTNGIRGYSVSGLMFSYPPWSAYTNAISHFTAEAWAADKKTASLQEFWFTYSDASTPWAAYSAPTNVCRLSALGDLPDEFHLRTMGSGNYYDLIWADDRALTEESARLRYRFLWYDHSTAMPFTVQGDSTVPGELGGSTERVLVTPQRPDELTMDWFELPALPVLPDVERDFSRPTAVTVRTAPGHVEGAGDSLLIGGARVWDDAKDLGIQWGWTTTSGAQAGAFNVIPLESWQKYIRFQQSDTYLVMLGVNDLLGGMTTGSETADRVRTLVERISSAHDAARLEDPTIAEARFLVVSPCDSYNTLDDGNYYSNTHWVDLAKGLRTLVDDRDDAAFIDLRSMVENELGEWRDWRFDHTRDGIHPRGPYFHDNGDVHWECSPYPRGSMYFAGLVWNALCSAADSPPNPIPGDFCASDVTGDCVIDGEDLFFYLGNWGSVPEGDPADLNGDLVVDGIDLAIMLSNWGHCP